MTSEQLIGIGLAVYVAWIYMNVLIADAKNLKNFTPVFLFSIFLTPFIGYLYVLGMPKED